MPQGGHAQRLGHLPLVAHPSVQLLEQEGEHHAEHQPQAACQCQGVPLARGEGLWRDGRRSDDGEVAGETLQLQLEGLLRLLELKVLGTLPRDRGRIGLQRRLDRRQSFLDLGRLAVAAPVNECLGRSVGRVLGCLGI